MRGVIKMLDKKLFYFNVDVDNKEDLLERIGKDLYDSGYVKDTYIQALHEREEEFPTGLPLNVGVAIPHTSIEHVNSNKLVFIKPKKSIVFHEMGNNDEEVNVELVIFIVIKDEHNHMKALSTIIDIIQDETILTSLVEANDKDAFEEIILNKFEINLEGDN